MNFNIRLLQLLKVRKKGIRYGILSILILSTFFVQVNLFSIVTTPIIHSYLTSQIYSDSRILVDGDYENLSQFDYRTLSQIEVDLIDSLENQSQLIIDSIQFSSTWMDFTHIGENYETDVINKSIPTIPKFISNNSFIQLKNELYESFTINETLKPFINGILYLDEGLYEFSYSEQFNYSTPTVKNVNFSKQFSGENLVLPVLILSSEDTNSINSSKWKNFFDISQYYFSNIGVLYFTELALQNENLKTIFRNEKPTLYFSSKLNKNHVVDSLFWTDNFYNSFQDYLIECTNTFSEYQLSQIQHVHNLDSMISLINQYKTIFTVIQILILSPLFLFTLFAFYQMNSTRNEAIRKKFLNKLLIMGFSRENLILYLIFEIFSISIISYIISEIGALLLINLSLGIVNSAIWEDRNKLMLNLIFKGLIDPTIIIAIFSILLIINFRLIINTLLANPGDENINNSLNFSISKKFSSYIELFVKFSIGIILALISVLLTFILSIQTSSSNNVEIYEFFRNITLILLLLFMIIEFINPILNFSLKKISNISALTDLISYMVYFHKTKKNFIRIQVITIVVILVLFFGYNSFKTNGIRANNLLSGADVVIESTVEFNSTYYSQLKNNTSVFKNTAILNNTELMMDSNDLNKKVDFHIITIDPQDFFKVGYLEDAFFSENSLSKISDLLRINNNILVFNDTIVKFSKLFKDKSFNFNGTYTNTNNSASLNLSVVDTFFCWPKLTIDETTLSSNSIVLVMTYETFSSNFNINNSIIKTSYWLNFQDDLTSEQTLKHIIVPDDDSYSRIGMYRDHPLTIGFLSIIEISLVLSLLYLLLITVQIYYTIYANLIKRITPEFAIFRSIGVSISDIKRAHLLYILIMNSLVFIISILAYFLFINPLASVVSMLYYFPIIYSLQIDIILVIFIIQFSTCLIPYLNRNKYSDPISLQIKLID